MSLPMRVKIRVGDNFLDTFKKTDELFFITDQRYDLRQLERRKANFTRDLEIPSTKNNLSALDLLSNEWLDNPARPCALIIDDITIWAGTLIVGDKKDNIIAIIIFSGNFDLFELLPNRSIKDLDLNAYSFPWTQAGISAIKTNTDGCTSVNSNFFDLDSLDDGSGQVSNFISSRDIKNWGFAFYYKTLVKEILEQVGYTPEFDTNLEADDLFDDLVIPCPVILPGSQEDIVAGTVNRTTDYVNDASVTLGAPDRVTFSVVSDPSGMWNGVNDEWVVPTTGDWRIIFDYNVTVTGDANQGPAEVSVLVNNTEYLTKEWYSGTSNEHDRIELAGTLTAGDTVHIETTAERKNPSKYDVLTIFTGATFGLQQDIPDPTGTLYPQDWLPDINQRDALMGFLKLFNCIIDANPFSRTAKMIRFIDYKAESPQDLTSNLTTAPTEEENSIKTYYRTSLLTYSNDNITRTDTDKEVSFNDALLPQRGSILTQLFSGSDDDGSVMEVEGASMSFSSAQNLTTTAGSPIFTFGQIEVFKVGDYLRYQGASSVNDEIHRIRFASSGTGGQVYNNWAATLSNVDVQIIRISTNDITARIARIRRNQSIGAQLFTRVNGYTGANVLVNVNVITFTDLQWEQLEPVYYKPLFDALRTAKILHVWMKFNTIEFYSLDYTKPVYIKGLNGTYHINKLEQWKLNVPCRVELIRINSLI